MRRRWIQILEEIRSRVGKANCGYYMNSSGRWNCCSAMLERETKPTRLEWILREGELEEVAGGLISKVYSLATSSILYHHAATTPEYDRIRRGLHARNMMGLFATVLAPELYR